MTHPTAKSVTSLAATLLLALGAMAAPAHAGGGLELDPEFLRDLAEARRATAPFHHFDYGVEAGWSLRASPCEETAEGGMGYHYVNLDLWFNAGMVDVTLPQALLYEPRRNGMLRLVGVEYIVPASQLPEGAPIPELFGQQFHFNPFIPGGGAWALHAWIWRHNPSGMFADWNPNVSCEFAD